MRDVLTRPRPHAGIRNILPAALAVLLVLGGAFAGEPTKGEDHGSQRVKADKDLGGFGRSVVASPAVVAASQPTEPRVMQVVRLRHANPRELANVLHEMQVGTGTARIMPHGFGKSLIIAAPAKDIPLLMDMVEQLDQELQTTAPRIQTYELKSRSADQQLLDVLTDILGKRCVAVDKHRQLVIVTGDDELQQEAERLLREMDAPIPAIPVPSLSIRKIRIAWLVSGPDDLMEKLSLPPTLKDAADEVGRILGSPPPGLLAQSVIDTSGGQDFEMNTLVNIPTLDPCHLKIKGEMRMDDRNQPALKLRIEAAWTSKQPQPAPGRPPQIQPPTVTGNFGIDTNIKAVPDQDIVLGVSPTGDIASAFVVRILE